MTDFLLGLIDRAFDRAPALQRRRPSLFERETVDARLTAENLRLETREEAEIQPSVIGEKATFIPGPPRPSRAEADHNLAPTIGRNGLETIRPAQPAPPEIHLHVEQREGEQREVESARQRSRPPAEIKETRTHLIERIVERVVEPSQPVVAPGRLNSERDESARAFSLAPGAPGQIRVIHRAEPDLTDDRERRRDQLLQKEITARPVEPVKPLIEPVRRAIPTVSNQVARLQNIATPPPAPLAPTIQVTIGRIEVRATPAPAKPARSAQPAAPRLSLEDYLKSRTGGGR